MTNLNKWIKAMQSQANATFPRNDPYGSGLKEGLGLCLDALKRIKKGMVYDDTLGIWIAPDGDEK